MTHAHPVEGFDGDVEILAGGAVILKGTEVDDDLRFHLRENIIVINSASSDDASIRAPDMATLRGVFADEKIRADRNEEGGDFASEGRMFRGWFFSDGNNAAISPVRSRA